MVLSGCGQESSSPAFDFDAAVTATESMQDNLPPVPANRAVTVYTTGSTAKLKSVLDAYRAETGVRSRILADEFAQSSDLLNHPELPPTADLYISDSFAEVWAVAEADELRPSFSDVLSRNVPASLRDPESRWVGLSARARIVVYNPDLVLDAEISGVINYAALGDNLWRDRLCLSSSKLAENRSLVAYLIDKQGLRETEITVRQWRGNFGSRIYEDDAELLSAISAGECAIGIADSSEFEKFRSRSGATKPTLAAHWFSAGSSFLIDIRGAGVSRHATDPVAAVKLMEWLGSKDANALFALQEMEFPANVESIAATTIAADVERVRQAEAIANLGFLQEDAQKLIERAKYP